MPEKLGISRMQKNNLSTRPPAISAKFKGAVESMPSGASAGAGRRGKPRLTITAMQELARSKGGKCLSAEYANAKTKLMWQCKKGHMWPATPNSIKYISWCPTCVHERKRLTIQQMRKIAKERGGECLSPVYVDAYSKLMWQCAKGHRWRASPYSVKRGRWCPRCAFIANGLKHRLTIEDMQELAKSRGGKCLSTVYTGMHSKLKWQCRKRHIWPTAPASIKRGTWCPTCAAEARAAKKRFTIGQMQKIARKMGGKCLSTVYVSTLSKLRWRCRKGHEWNAIPGNIIYHKEWCPHCSREKRRAKAAKKAAKKKGKARKR